MGKQSDNQSNYNYSNLSWTAFVSTTNKELDLHQIKYEQTSEEEVNMLDWFQKQRIVAWTALKQNNKFLDQIGRAWDYPSDFNFEDAIKPWSLRIAWCVLMITHLVVVISGIMFIYQVLSSYGPHDHFESCALVYAFCVLGTDITVISVLSLFLLILSAIFRINAFKDAMPLFSLVADGMQSTIYNCLAIYGFILTQRYFLSLLPPEKHSLQYAPILRYVFREMLYGDLQHDRVTVWFLLSTLVLGLFYFLRSIRTVLGIAQFIGREMFGTSADESRQYMREAYLYTGGPEPYERHLLQLEKQLAMQPQFRNQRIGASGEFATDYKPHNVVHSSPWGMSHEYKFGTMEMHYDLH